MLRERSRGHQNKICCFSLWEIAHKISRWSNICWSQTDRGNYITSRVTIKKKNTHTLIKSLIFPRALLDPSVWGVDLIRRNRSNNQNKLNKRDNSCFSVFKDGSSPRRPCFVPKQTMCHFKCKFAPFFRERILTRDNPSQSRIGESAGKITFLGETSRLTQIA